MRFMFGKTPFSSSLVSFCYFSSNSVAERLLYTDNVPDSENAKTTRTALLASLLIASLVTIVAVIVSFVCALKLQNTCKRQHEGEDNGPFLP